MYFPGPDLLALAGLSSDKPEESQKFIPDFPLFNENELKKIVEPYKEDSSTTHSTQKSCKGKNKSSKFHNKLTQTITTYKQILEPYYQ